MDISKLIDDVRGGELDGELKGLYVPKDDGALGAARERCVEVLTGLRDRYGEHESAGLFSGPGRTEIGGNHTDHQHGRVLCGSVNLDILAAAAPNGERVIHVSSEGYPEVTVDLEDLEPKADEQNTSAALVRGVAAGIKARGLEVRGFDAYAVSGVPAGAGLSSSAAYEVLIGNIVNALFCGGSLTATDIAEIGQYAENVYFGKPCGLMDQMGSSVGGAVAIDFKDPSAPEVTKVSYDFGDSKYHLAIIDTGSCHADLTGDYAEITRDMGAVAHHFGKEFLRDVPEAEFRASIPVLREECGDRAVLRALHYFNEDRRAAIEAECLKKDDFTGFLSVVNASGHSSELLLQNIWPSADTGSQAVTLAIALGREILRGRGAIRVHGGGFAGTVQAFVPEDLLESFRRGMEAVFGEGKCHILSIRPVGGWAHL